MNPRLAFSIAEACEAARAGRTAIYDAIGKGELRAVKRGRRTLILADDLKGWLDSLPVITRWQGRTRGGSGDAKK